MKMNRTTAALRVLLVALMAAIPATGFASLRYARGVGLGASFPVHPSQFTDVWNAGITLSGSFEVIATSRLRAGIEVGFAYHDVNEDALRDYLGVSSDARVNGNDLWIVPVTLTGTFDLLERGNTKPFLLGGVGIYTFGASDLTVDGTPVGAAGPDETVFGGHMGAGVRTPIGIGLELSVEAAYHIVATEGDSTQFLPIRLRLIF